MKVIRRGIAVSEAQGTIDWRQVKDGNIDFAMLCCGTGGESAREDRNSIVVA